MMGEWWRVKSVRDVLWIIRHLLHGDWYCGIHTGGDKFSAGRDWYDGWWYYLNLWPFWVNVHY